MRTTLMLTLCLFTYGCFSESNSDRAFVERYARTHTNVRTFEVGNRENRVLAVEISSDQGEFVDLLPSFCELEELNRLALYDTKISEEILIGISKLSIRELDLSGCELDGRNLKILEKMPRLKSLVIYRSGIKDQNMAQLHLVRGLVEIDAGENEITGVGFDQLGFERLLKLSLSSCPITDEGLKSIAKLPALKELNINMTQVTGAGLVNLAPLHTLERVHGPDGISVAEGAAAYRAHIAAKQQARKEGKLVPPDEQSPFRGYLKLESEAESKQP